MANIALRSYQQKIESLIEKYEIDQAIANCQLIFGIFPKNLKTYQILSKAYLQNQNFDLAEKVFNIILRVYPDDFVSHIGKSIIAETNGNIPSAIDHMKFAFENQPSNEGLQIELKRLHAINDGVEPNKILLTRGALIKMYLKGNLFDQAIAEARIGLSESPHRIDYLLAMAKSFYMKGDLIQAVEKSIEIVSQLPYCWDANEILNNVISKNHTLESNNVYHQRLVEMDPYFDFMLESTKSIFDVPDIAVLVDDVQSLINANFDFSSFIDQAWNLADSSPSTDADYQNDVDWDSIITKAVESHLNTPSNEVLEFPNAISYDSVIETGEMTPNSRKILFLEKLKTSKTNADNLEQQSNWTINDEGETVHGSPYMRNEECTDDDDKKADQIANMLDETSSNVGEDGVFDLDIQPAISHDADFDQSANIWIKDESENPGTDINKTSPKLADTQPIEVAADNTADLFIESIRALQGGNTKYALSLLQKLTSDKNDLKDVLRHLEDAVIRFPENYELLLFLGEVYTKLDENEKALTVFRKAQKLISL